MNKLDILKNQWKNQKFDKNFSKEELFHLTQKKSISSIKWIFIFSCIEFFAYLLFPFVIPDYFDAFEYYKSIHLFEFSIVTNILGYFILSYFMIQFYQNYRKIKTTDSIKMLIQRIINSRKSVNRYIIYNLAVFLGFLVVVLINAFKYDQNYIDLLDSEASGGGFIVKMGLVIIGIMILVLIFLIGFYYLIYGRYFFKLKKNVKELQIIEE
tara:strand:- start:1915 stop:2547 length:633 start_codon:yes stop_codon:yes gene_type:complete